MKLKLSKDVWVADLLWAGLAGEMKGESPWVVGGDLNASITFDTTWSGGPWGNQELMDRMADLGFVECLFHNQGRLTPTFRNKTGGKVIHQIDHLFVSSPLEQRLRFCTTGDAVSVFGDSLSDHPPTIAAFTAVSKWQ